MTEYEKLVHAYLQRFINHVKEYHTPETTVGRVVELKFIIPEEEEVLEEVFGFTKQVITEMYYRGKYAK